MTAEAVAGATAGSRTLRLAVGLWLRLSAPIVMTPMLELLLAAGGCRGRGARDTPEGAERALYTHLVVEYDS